ncbi:MAG: tetratricopeptide repeat protein, partial [Pyrinomonadaceae bacterium]
MNLRLLIVFIFLVSFVAVKAQDSASVTISTQPRARIWVNGVFWGTTDEKGEITLKNLPSGVKRLRVRAVGFKEANLPLRITGKRVLKIELVKTENEAELAFQRAEEIVSSDRQKAIELYRQAINLNQNYAEAYVGLARALSDSGDTEEALEAISKARRIRPVYPEASAVEGRIYKSEGNEQKAISAFQRAIREGRGFQPEAHTGLGLLYQEKAEGFASEGDFEQERKTYDLAAYHLKKAIEQLAGAPEAVVVYQILGALYEKQERYIQAIRLYEEFLRKFPDSDEPEAIESFITQIKRRLQGQN